MSKNAMYWGTIILAFFVCLIYNIIITKKYNIKAWKMIIITFLFFIVNWGVTYITAFIEAGLKTPPSSNGVRAWIYIPIFFYICSVMFKIDFRKLCDAMTPCLMLGVALGHVGCVFGECCHGFLYDGFGAIYNSKVGGMVFPTQIVECLFALLLFISYVIYNCKTKYKVSGRLYAVMLIFFQSSRVGFEFLRDNRKIWLGLSSLAYHAIFGTIVGLVWLFFTTAAGKLFAIKVRNFFRKILKKELIPVLTKEEYKKQIIDMQNKLTNPETIEFQNNEVVVLKELRNNQEKEIINKTNKNLISILVISSVIFALSTLYLILLFKTNMATYLILFFEVFALVVMIYSITHLIIYNKVLKKSKDTSVTYINKPDDEVNLLVVNKKGYKIYFNHDYYKKLKIVSVDEDKILLQHNKNEEIEIDIDSLINL